VDETDRVSIKYEQRRFLHRGSFLQPISKRQIAPKDKARADEKAEHTLAYVSILKKPATPQLGVR
jgi:hypothetical protein